MGGPRGIKTPREHRAEGQRQRIENMQRGCLAREGGGQGIGLKQGEPTTLSSGQELEETGGLEKMAFLITIVVIVVITIIIINGRGFCTLKS